MRQVITPQGINWITPHTPPKASKLPRTDTHNFDEAQEREITSCAIIYVSRGSAEAKPKAACCRQKTRHSHIQDLQTSSGYGTACINAADDSDPVRPILA